jgi:hypothetical protein
MGSVRKDIPAGLQPHVSLSELNEPLTVLTGPFRLVGPSEGVLDSNLVFRWLPSTAVAFDASYSGSEISISEQYWLESQKPSFRVPVLIGCITQDIDAAHVRGVVQGPISFGDARFEVLRFTLANFPKYFGEPVCFERGTARDYRVTRLEVSSDLGRCRLDAIPDADDLREMAERDSGYYLSHVGDWTPTAGEITAVEAQSVLGMLRFWFGLLGGAWSGPLFPEGLVNGAAVWREFAPWKLGDSREVKTWLPQRKPLDLNAMFSGFLKLWHDPEWQGPLKHSVSWLLEANSPGTALESTIILAQVALELLAWVQLVEARQVHSRTDFRHLSAAGRMRALLQDIGVPAGLPDHLTSLPSLQQGDAFDGPGVVTRVRNALVHATEDNRAVSDGLDGLALHECSQLALQYLELTLLALCGYRGYYARRGWRGWKGPDEVLVPWV